MSEKKNNINTQMGIMRMSAKPMNTKQKVLHSAAILFLENGYEKASIREIAAHAKVNRGSVLFAIKSKENLLATLADLVVKEQFKASYKVIEGKTDDPILYYAAETAMQLYMTESSEQVREIYANAYALPSTSEMIYEQVTEKLIPLFKQYNPDWVKQDFYEREIASAGIMRAYMAKKCNERLTIERKVKLFLETSLLIYNVPKEKIDEAVSFVADFDFATIAKNTIDGILNTLKKNSEE